MSLKLELFHSIGNPTDTESADVRRFIAESGLKDLIDFRNVAYDEAAADLFERSGGHQTPVLIANGTPIAGKSRIIDYLKAQILRWRD
jgi:hypothetical protein